MENREVEDTSRALGRKWSRIQRAVKYNWDLAYWQSKNDEKLLEAKLKKYQEQKKKRLSLFTSKKHELEKNLVVKPSLEIKQRYELQNRGQDLPVVNKSNWPELENKPEAALPDKLEKTQFDKLPEKAEKAERNNDVSTFIESKEKTSPKAMHIYRHRSISLIERPKAKQSALLPGRKQSFVNNVNKAVDKEQCRALDKYFSHVDRFSIKHIDATVSKSCENIPTSKDSPKLPKIYSESQRYRKNIDLSSRSVRSRSFTMTSCSQSGSQSQFPSVEKDMEKGSKDISSLAEQFEKLRDCRYLRTTLGR